MLIISKDSPGILYHKIRIISSFVTQNKKTMKKIHLILLITAIAFLGFSACSDKKGGETESSAPKSQAEIDDEKLQTYLDENDIEAETLESGLYYVIIDPGQGEKPKVTNIVTMHYKGYLLDGTVFESSYDSGKPLRYQLGGLIEGWRQGVPLIGRGGKATLYIPSGLAYGPRGSGPTIGPNTPLIFDVELLDFQ